MNYVHEVVFWLEGKKAMLTAIAALILSYLVKDGTLSPALGELLNGVLVIINGGALGVARTQNYNDFKLGKA